MAGHIISASAMFLTARWRSDVWGQVDGEKSKTLNVPYWGTVLREQKKSANTWYTVLYDVDNRTQAQLGSPSLVAAQTRTYARSVYACVGG